MAETPQDRVPGQPGDAVIEFRNDDRGYLRWVAANPNGYVINIQQSYNASDARLHRANCYTIDVTPAKGDSWTGHYVKICSLSSRALDRWAREHTGGPVRRCGTCSP